MEESEAFLVVQANCRLERKDGEERYSLEKEKRLGVRINVYMVDGRTSLSSPSLRRLLHPGAQTKRSPVFHQLISSGTRVAIFAVVRLLDHYEVG